MRHSLPGRLAFLLAGLALLPAAVGAAPQEIEVEISPEMVEFFPETTWRFAQLIVAGPECVYLQRLFRTGERIAFTPFDASGEPLPDGVYSWDLRLGPEAEVRGLDEPAGQGQICRGREDLPPLIELTSTGYVGILDARFVNPDLEEDRFQADGGLEALAEPVQSMSAGVVLTNADGVIRNSLCVGFDCPNSPSFGSDTIRLQENNLRIHFDDTSTLAGFPNRDWRLVANDSASGGASKFSIEDSTAGRVPFTVEGNAPANSLYVDDGGRVGIGTSTPVVELHVRDGDTPTLRLEQDGSSGFSPQTWDLAGNETNFFVRDVTGGSALPFRIQPGAASNTLFLASNEEVGVGTSSPSASLHVRRSDGTAAALVEEVNGTAATRTLMTVRNNGQTRFVIHNTAAAVPAAGGYFFAQFDNGRFVIRPNGGGSGFFMDENGNITAEANLTVNGTFSNPSSRTLKENFSPLDPQEVLARLVEVPVTEWSYKGEEARHVGPVTEDFEAAFGLGTVGTHIVPLDVQGVTMAALQGLYQRLVALEGQRADLEAEVAELRALLEERAE